MTAVAIDLTIFSASDMFIIQGDAAGDFAGIGVSSAGDCSDDLIVRAPHSDNGGRSAREAAVIH